MRGISLNKILIQSNHLGYENFWADYKYQMRIWFDLERLDIKLTLTKKTLINPKNIGSWERKAAEKQSKPRQVSQQGIKTNALSFN